MQMQVIKFYRLEQNFHEMKSAMNRIVSVSSSQSEDEFNHAQAVWNNMSVSQISPRKLIFCLQKHKKKALKKLF